MAAEGAAAPRFGSRMVGIRCDDCGSTEIEATVDCKWDIGRQQWVGVDGTIGSTWCQACEGETEIEEFELPQDEGAVLEQTVK